MATAPGSVTATRTSDTSISVGWGLALPSFSGTVTYDVQVQANFGNFVTVLTATPSRSASFTNLTLGNSYRYQVRSRETRTGFTTQLSSYTVSNRIYLPPPVPPSVTLSRVDDLASIRVQWAASNGAVGYDVDRLDGNTWNRIRTGTIVRDITDGNLTRGNTYRYRVRANSDGGTSAFAASGLLTLVPFRPASVSASLSGDTSIRVTWPAANGATGYNVDRSENGGGYTRVSSNTALRDITYGSLTRGSTYVFRVFSLNAGGSSPTARESDSVSIPLPPPSAPSSASISKDKRDVTISLGTATAPAGTTISSYEIEIRSSGGSYGSRRTVSTSSRSTTYTGLNPGVTYQGRGRAVGTGGAGDWRETGTVTISPPPTAPSTISAIRSFRSVAVALGTSTAASDVTISGYEIQRRDSTNGGATWGAWGNVRTTNLTDRTTTYTGLIPLSTYEFRGAAQSDFGLGAFSTSAPIFIPDFPNPPQQVLALQEGASVRVIVTAPTFDGGAPVLTYRIEKRVSDDFGSNWEDWGDSITIPANEPVYLYSGLELQRTYQFRALATNSEGDSEAFTESNAVYLPVIVRILEDGQFRLPGDYKRYDEGIGTWIGLSTYKRYFNGVWTDLT